MWVGDYNLTESEELTDALGIEPNRYTFRNLLFAAAEAQKVEIKDFTVAGSRAQVVCGNNRYTKTSDFVDTFLNICKEKYGEVYFARLMRCDCPEDPKRHPQAPQHYQCCF